VISRGVKYFVTRTCTSKTVADRRYVLYRASDDVGLSSRAVYAPRLAVVVSEV
jgi:hypothetical protein